LCCRFIAQVSEDHLHVGDFHGAIHLGAVPGSRGVLAAVAVAVGELWSWCWFPRGDVGHGSGYPNRVSDVRFQILSGHEFDTLRRFGLRAGLLGGLCAGLPDCVPDWLDCDVGGCDVVDWLGDWVVDDCPVDWLLVKLLVIKMYLPVAF